MRRLSTEFLNAFLLVLCVWCYCFGNKRKGKEKKRNGRKLVENASGAELNKPKKNSVVVIPSGNYLEEPSTTKDEGLATTAIELTTVNEEIMQKGYVNPDFYVPFIDSESDLSSMSLTRTSKKQLALRTDNVNLIRVNSNNHTSERPSSAASSTGGQENKSFCGDNEDTNAYPAEVNRKQSCTDNYNTPENENNLSSRSICSSSVKSSDFVEVLETARKNEEEIGQVRNSYYEKLSEAAASLSFIPISVHDELLKETVNFHSITEELRKVGDKYLIEKVFTGGQQQQQPLDNCQTLTTIDNTLLIVPKSESPDSGMESAKNSTNGLMDKLVVSTSVQDVCPPPKSSLSPNNYNSKSSECLKRLVDAGNHPTAMVKWRSAAEVTPKSDHHQQQQMDFVNNNATNNNQQVVTTTIVQTATTTLTQVSKRFSDNWKEYEIKTTRRRIGSTRSSASASSDDLKDLHITVQSEQGAPKALVDDTSRTVSHPRDQRVTNEYLTNLSHMLTAPDNCGQFHKDSCHGSLASIDSVEMTNGHLKRTSMTIGQTDVDRQEKTVVKPSVKFEPATPNRDNDADDDKTLSSVIASIANSLLQSRQHQYTIDKSSSDVQGNSAAIVDDSHAQQRSSAEIGTSLDVGGGTERSCCHSNCTAPVCSTLVISLHLSPSNLTERNGGKDYSPLAKITNSLDSKLKIVNLSANTVSPRESENKTESKTVDVCKDNRSGDTFKNTSEQHSKSPKGVVIEEMFVQETTKLNKESPEGSLYDNMEDIENDECVEDINIRRAREAAAFAQKFFQYGYKYS